MNSRTTWMLVLVALALGAVLWISDRRPGSRVTNGQGLTSTFLAPRPEDVVRLELQRSNTVVKVTRMDTGWILMAPLVYAAQPTGIENLLNVLSKLVPVDFIPGKQVAAQPGGMAAFGLDQPSTLTVELRGGRPMIFRLGGPTPLEGRFYLQVAGTDGVFVADASLLSALPVNAEDWRDRGLFDLRHTAYDRVELQQRGRIVFEANYDGQGWRLTRPLSARANTDAIEALVNQLQAARVSAFVSDGTLVNPETYGLLPPEAELVVGRGSNDLVRLQFGARSTNAPDQEFVQRALQTNVVLLPTNATALVRLPLDTFRDRQLVGPLRNVSSIEFRGNDRTVANGADRFVARREGTNWFVVEPHRFPADAARIEETFQTLESLGIEQFTTDVVDNPAVYGLDMPVREYAIGVSTNLGGYVTNTVSFSVQFGGVPTNNIHFVYARRSDEPGVYSIVRAELSRLPETANQLRDWRFAVSNVVGVTIVRSNVVREITRTPTGEWAVSKGAPVSLIPDALDETVYRLGNYNPYRYAVRDLKAVETAGGYAAVAHEVTLHFREGSGPLRQWRLRFGREVPPLVPALVYFDEDPTPLQVRFPSALYRDVLRDFNAP